MKKFFSKFFAVKSSSRQTLFYILAIFLFLIAGGFVISNFLFLISNFNEALLESPPLPPPLQFDIEGFEKLDLIGR